jgi:hypothetical protein
MKGFLLLDPIPAPGGVEPFAVLLACFLLGAVFFLFKLFVP